MGDSDSPRAAGLPAGYDESNPYADADPSAYPDWWWENVELFRAHGLRPYRPPTFADGELVPEVVSALEAELSVDVDIRVLNPQAGNDWEVQVDGERVITVERNRRTDGRSVYRLRSDELETAVRDAVTE